MSSARPTSRPAAPAGIDRLVSLAAGDARFRKRLFADRLRAARSAGVRLSESERTLLLATPDEHLAAIVDAVPQSRTARRTFIQSAAAWVVGVFGGVALTGCGSDHEPEVERGTRPDPVGGSRPDDPPVGTGSRPDVPESKGS